MVLKEAELPVNVTPGDSKLADPEERARFARVFEPGPERARAVLCCRCSAGTPRPGTRGWISQQWPMRRGALFLMPGDSPVGFRLPLKSLPYAPPSAYPFLVEQDPTEAASRRCPRPTSDSAEITARARGHARRRRSRASRVRRHHVGSAHRARRRAARRAAARLHAAGRACWKIIWTCWRRSRRPPGDWACRCTSRAIRRRSTGACR